MCDETTKYSEHCSKHASTQPTTNFAAFPTTSNADQQQTKRTDTKDSQTCKTANSSKKSKSNAKSNASNRIAGGIPKLSSFLHNRNANKQKFIVQRQQSENVPSFYLVQQSTDHSSALHNAMKQQQQPQNFIKNVAIKNKKITHSTSMDSIESPYQLRLTCPRHGTHQLVDQNPMSKKIEYNLATTSGLENKRLKTTFSLNSMRDLQEEGIYDVNKDNYCSSHQRQSKTESSRDKSSQTEETNLNEYCSNVNQQQMNYTTNYQHRPYYLKQLPPAHSLPPTHLPPTSTLLKSSSSFPTSQPSSCHFYHQHYRHQHAAHQVEPFINENRVDKTRSSFYNFITSQQHLQAPVQFSRPAASKTITQCDRKISNQTNLLFTRNQLDLEANQSELDSKHLEDQMATANGSGKNYFEHEQTSTTSEGISTGGIINAMAEIIDDGDSASRFNSEMFSSSLGEFDDRLNVTAVGYSLGDNEISREGEFFEQELEKDNSQMCGESKATEKIKSYRQEAHFVPLKNCSSKIFSRQGYIAALRREEDFSHHERNNNECLDYQLNDSQVLEDIQKIEPENAALENNEVQSDHRDVKQKQRTKIDNLSELTIRKLKEDEKNFIRQSSIDESDLQSNRNQIGENASAETKKRLRDSTSTTDSSSLMNDRQNKKQETRSAKRNWFFWQISNSSKSYCASSSTNCDTCSIITNQDTIDDNVFGEKSNGADKYITANCESDASPSLAQQASATSLLNQTRNKLAQLRSQIKQQTSVESDQSAFTTTTISSNLASNLLSRQASQSSFGLKNMFRKKKKRLSHKSTSKNESAQRLRKSAENLNSNQTADQQQPQLTQDQQTKLKSSHIRTISTTGSDKRKCVGGIRSKPLKQIVHPLERSITGFFLITLFFTMLAIISGVPIVCLLFSFLPFAISIRFLITCDFRLFYSNNEHKCTPQENYWLNSTWKNNCKKGQAVCLFMIDPAFTLEQCRDLIQSRLIQKVGTERFRWILRHRGFCRSPYWERIPFNEFDVKQHVSALKPINSTKKLQQYIMQLMHVPLDLTQKPGWFIHYVKIHDKLKTQVALIIRVHQALFDGINLSKILIGLLSDQAPIMFSLAEQQRYRLEYEKLRTVNRFPPASSDTINNPFFNNLACALMKPRFGGFNFSVNICRAVMVGPLTFALWMMWAFTRRNANFLLSSKFFQKLHKYIKTIDLDSMTEDEEIELTDGRKTNFLSVTPTWKSNKKRSPVSCTNHSTSVETHSKFTPSTTLTTTTSGSKYRLRRPEKSIYSTSIPFASVQRVKQVTRSSLNDVVLSCVAGAVRDYLVNVSNIPNPPDLGITLPVDISVASDHDMENIGVNYVFLTAPLPTSIESSIPRLWEIRHLMEELKTSADPAVMHGVTYFLHSLLPSCLSNFLLNLIHRNSSVCLSNLQGPKEPITFYTHPVYSINYWMSPPPNIPLVFNVLSYGNLLTISISSTAQLVPCARRLGRFLKQQFHNYHHLLARRRVPGERSRLRQLAAQYAQLKQPLPAAAYLATKFKVGPSSPESTIAQIGGKDLPDDFTLISSSRSSSIRTTPSPTTSALSPTTVSPMTMDEAVEAIAQNFEKGVSMSSSRRNTIISSISQMTSGQLADRLNDVQSHLYELSEELQDEELSDERKEQLELEIDEFKGEFGVLMKQMRRRKSIADYSLHNVVINVESEFEEDDDIDGELRPPIRRFSFGVSSRRSSVVSTSAISIPNRFNVSPPNLLTRRSIIPTSSPEPSSSPERTIKEETV